MYVVVAGGGKVGSNVTRSLLDLGHEVTMIEQRPDRFARLEEEFGPVVIRGDATEIAVLERAGIARPPELLLAVTGDDEDNLVISQIAKETYGVRKAIARVNDPRNQQHFDLLGITQTLCATTSILGLVEHEVPEHGLVRLLELQKEGLAVVEVQVEGGSPAAGKKAGGLSLPAGSRLISVFRQGRTELVEPSTVVRPGDQVLAVVPTDEAAATPARASRRAALSARLQPPVVPVRRTTTGMISSRPSHMRKIIVTFETSPSGANDPKGPVIPNAGPPFPSALADDANVSSAPSGTSADRGVDRDHRRADGPEADVEQDERGDRAQRALVDRCAVEPDRHDDLRADGLVELAAQDLAERGGGGRP